MTDPQRPRVVHNKREPFDVYIGRPSKWGNPFSHKDGTQAKFKVASRDEAVDSYRDWIATQPDLLAALPELRGKVLGCWCAPLRCHGDVLVELVPCPSAGERSVSSRESLFAFLTPLLPPGFCLNCGHHEEAHKAETPLGGAYCDTEISDYGNLDCQCPGLRLCAACEGDPEAHDLHVCGRADV